MKEISPQLELKLETQMPWDRGYPFLKSILGGGEADAVARLKTLRTPLQDLPVLWDHLI